jgi:hypothetical protein
MSSSLLPQEPAALAFPTAALFGLAFVVQLLAAPERDLDLGAALGIEIELERHEGHAFALDGADQFIDLALVQQQLARTLGRVIEPARLQIFGDVGVVEPDLAVARAGI